MTAPAQARWRRAAPIVLALATAACFLPVLRNGLVDWDDSLNLTENQGYRGFSPAHLRWMFTTVHGGHYQPLTWLTLAADHALWGMNPVGYHLTSLVLHVATAVAVYFLTARLLRAAGATPAGPGLTLAALIGALLFAIHPLRVESVAWVSERRDVLAGFFYVLALLAYLRRREDGRARWLVVSLVSLLLSLFSKAWGMTLPLVLLVLDAYPLGRLGSAGTRRAALIEKIPFAVLALAGAGVAFLAQRPIPAMRTLAHHGVLARAAQAAYGLCFYVWKTLVPAALSPLYLLEPRLDPTRPRYVAAMAAVVVVTIALVTLRRRAPWALAAWSAYVAILSPVLGFVQTGPQLVADRYTYLACLPWTILGAAAVAHLRQTRLRAAVLPGVGVVLVLFGALTARQARVWRDSWSLWKHVLRLDPQSFIAYTNRGTLRQERGDRSGALADYTRALEIHPGYPLAWYNRGNIRHELGDLDGAIADQSVAITLTPEDPLPWNNRGWSREKKGDVRGAYADYEQALRVTPPDFQGRAKIEENLAWARRALAGP